LPFKEESRLNSLCLLITLKKPVASCCWSTVRLLFHNSNSYTKRNYGSSLM
jgi:hypothetical protein